MITITRASLTRRITLTVACLACAFALPTAVAGAAESIVRYTVESLPSYEQQLATGQIQTATFNKRIRSLRLTLKDGRHVLVKYPPHVEPQYVSALDAKHIPVTVLQPATAAKEAVKPVHHKLRYIAGGILIVVILVVGAVLMVDRRRKLAAE
jgi:hypothetical protein